MAERWWRRAPGAAGSSKGGVASRSGGGGGSERSEGEGRVGIDPDPGESGEGVERVGG